MDERETRYTFGDVELRVQAHELLRSGERVALRPRVFKVLCHLVEHRERVVGKSELLAAAWTDRTVEDSAVASSISEARKAIGQSSMADGPIKTVHGVGYRFIGELRESSQAGAASAQPSSSLLAVPAPERRGALASDGFVGRESQLESLRNAVVHAQHGNGSLWLVTGEAGVGKSRCIAEVARSVGREQTKVGGARCAEGGGAPAFWIWIQVLRSMLGDSGLSSAHDEIDALLASLDPSKENQGARVTAPFMVIDSVWRAIKAATAQAPHLLLIEDLQWADDASLEALAFIGAQLSQTHLCIIATQRDGIVETENARLRLMARVYRLATTISLSGLSAQEVRTQARSVAGSAVSREVADAIHARTAGNPLFVQETVQWVLSNHGAEALARAPAPELGMPQSVREILRERIDSLGPNVREVLELASVVGREFGLQLMTRMVNDSGPELLPLLDVAIAGGLLRFRGHGGRYEFVHDLVGQVLYDGLPTARRIALHLVVAEALEDVEAAKLPLGELALHFHRALGEGSVADRAHEHALRAAAQAQRVFAHADVVRFLGWALDALAVRRDTTPRQRADLLNELANAQRAAGDVFHARKTVETLQIPLSVEHGFGDLLIRAAMVLRPVSASGATRTDKLSRYAIECGLTLLPEGDRRNRISALSRLAYLPPDSLDMRRSQTLSADAEKLARTVGDSLALLDALIARAYVLSGPAHGPALLDVTDQILTIAHQLGQVWPRNDAFYSRYLEALGRDDAEQASRAIEGLEETARVLRVEESDWACERLRTQRLFDRGDFEAAECGFRKLRDEGQRLGLDYAEDFYLLHRMLLARLRKGVKAHPRLQAVLTNANAAATLPLDRATAAVIELDLGHLEAASRRLRELASDGFAAVPENVDYLFTLSLLAEVAAGVGDRASAQSLYERLSPYPERNAVDGRAICGGCISHWLGLLAAILGNGAEAIEHLQRAVELNDTMGRKPAAVLSRAALAKALAVAGKASRGRAERSDALTHARTLGMEATVAALEAH